MKTFSISLFFFFSISLALQAQEEATKTYRKEKMNVMGATYSGYSTLVPYSEPRTSQYLSDYLKSLGKISERRNYTEIKETSWKSKDMPVKVYAMVTGDTTQSRIWIGHGPEAEEQLIAAIQDEMENMPYIMKKADLQQQIKEAEEAASYLSKEIRNTERNDKRLHNRLQQNADNKIRLEQALVQNAADKIQLEEDIVTNNQTKEEKLQAYEEVKKQLEYLKEKLLRL